ncbi:putative serine dehydratase domain-containing protein [Daldinia caldariorum]|uniref:putative serine dehydratase domain-containing protein n=1 Tax=Daldinia caldariorum TaxID=326644 RepID=UPI002008755F|nr:putative serine dehydratase domain-containing protein [Daldinia caldariorum]KAI1464252.1 putative serine dehydratase domain-containing protein [Daldinia caldariorum]
MAVQLSKDILRTQFVGKNLNEVITPTAVLDLAKVEANCNLMLEAAERLQLSWRAHIKTHKTEELTRLQVGDKSSSPVNLIVSTIIEAEKLVPLLKEYRDKGRKINVLYSFPLYASCLDRLALVSAELGAGALSVMIDHVDQVPLLASLASKSGGNPPLVFLKVNVGTNRAGVIPGTPESNALIDQLLASEEAGSSVLLGVYCHAGHSYAARKDWEAMGILGQEFEALKQVAEVVRDKRAPGKDPLVLSVGATPTATTIQHPDLASTNGVHGAAASNGVDILTAVPTSRLKTLLKTLKASNFALEVHAGVYPTLDVQQLAAHARDLSLLNSSMIGISVMADVASVYPARGPDGATEALVNAGSIALGREPCQEPDGKRYSAWGLVMPWGVLADTQPAPGSDFPEVHGGWQVAKISQEHGVLRWVGRKEEEAPLSVGQRVRIWPNHSCIASAGHAYYLVIDSRNAGREDEIIDVWPRWNGW